MARGTFSLLATVQSSCLFFYFLLWIAIVFFKGLASTIIFDTTYRSQPTTVSLHSNSSPSHHTLISTPSLHRATPSRSTSGRWGASWRRCCPTGPSSRASTTWTSSTTSWACSARPARTTSTASSMRRYVLGFGTQLVGLEEAGLSFSWV